MPYYNVHSHVFTMSNAPERFLELYLPRLAAKAIDNITNTRAGVAATGWLLRNLGGNGGKKYASFLGIGKSRNQLEVFEYLRSQYDDDSMVFIALTMYMEKNGAGMSLSGFEGQLEEIMSVKKQYPDNLLVFMGVDPRWKSTGTELRNTIAQYFNNRISVNATRSVYPFAGLKIYPSNGFYAFDERLKETLEWAAENEVPVLSHCNYLGGMYNNDAAFLKANLTPLDPYTGNPYSQPGYQKAFKFSKWLMGTNASRNNKNTCSYLLEPYSYRSLLTYFRDAGKPLKLCLAHYGGGEHIRARYNANGADPNQYFGVDRRNWTTQIWEMMQEFPGLYTDISYAVADDHIFNAVLQDMGNNNLRDRMLFGTDFFMTEQELPEQKNYSQFRSWANGQVLNNGNTVWQQLAQVNTERFLSGPFAQ